MISDESIIGNADKIIYYTKEFESTLQENLYNRINPFLISKIDLQSVRAFTYPDLAADS
jgi:hypothetical protein